MDLYEEEFSGGLPGLRTVTMTDDFQVVGKYDKRRAEL